MCADTKVSIRGGAKSCILPATTVRNYMRNGLGCLGNGVAVLQKHSVWPTLRRRHCE
jgi:hypothetical protein